MSATSAPRTMETRRSSLRTRGALLSLDPEQAGRTEEQHRHEHGEEQDLRDRGLRPDADDALDYSDGKPAESRAGHAAEASEHHDHEGLQQERGPDAGMDVIEREQRCRGDAHHRGRDAERVIVDDAIVDAEEAGDLPVLPDGADRPTKISAAEEGPQRADRRD